MRCGAPYLVIFSGALRPRAAECPASVICGACGNGIRVCARTGASENGARIELTAGRSKILDLFGLVILSHAGGRSNQVSKPLTAAHPLPGAGSIRALPCPGPARGATSRHRGCWEPAVHTATAPPGPCITPRRSLPRSQRTRRRKGTLPEQGECGLTGPPREHSQSTSLRPTFHVKH